MAFGDNDRWRYVLTKQFEYTSAQLIGIEFQNEWTTIKDGKITIQPGYAWDGCSPTFCFLGLIIFGPPDGAEYLGYPATYWASLVHDVLCQWKTTIPVKKSQAVGIFKELMIQSKFPLASLYAFMVQWFGPQNFAGGK